MPFRPRSAGRRVVLTLALAPSLFFLQPDPAAAVTHNVSVSNFVFTPANLTIAPGDVVRWNWVNGIHTTTSGPVGAPNGLWDAPIDMSNTFFQRTFNSAGSFPYHCTFHGIGGMAGTITVGAPNTSPVVQNPGTQNGTELEFFSVTVTATDANGDPLTMTDLDTHPSWSTFEDNGDNTCTLSGTPGVGEAGTYPVSVRASDGLATDTETFDIVIGAAPPVQVDLTAGGFVPGSVTILVGQSVRWVRVAGGNHTTTNGTGLADPNAGLIWDAELRAATPEFTFQFTNAGTFPYFCRAHPTETGTVVVEPLPSCVVSGADPLCAGAAGNTYSAAVAPSTGTITYSWSIAGNGSIVGGTTGSSVPVTAGAAGSFTLTMNGTRNGLAFECQKVVTVNAIPSCNVSGPDPVTEGTSGHAYTVAVTPSTGTLTYAWSIAGNGTLTGPVNGSSATVEAGPAGSFTVTANITRNGCPTICQKTVTVSSSGGGVTTVLVQSDQFVSADVSIAVGQEVKWQWVSGVHTTTSGYSSDPSHDPGALWDAPIDESNPTFTRQFDSPGYFPYFCIYHEAMGMRGSVLVGGLVGVGEGGKPGVRLFPSPNPFPGQVHLLVELARAERVTVDIYDLNGRKILGLLIADLPAGMNRVTWGGWDDRHQPVVPGVYFARLETGGGHVTVQKLFKMR